MEKIYIGLDVGTNSVGWAATDDNYNLLRLKGKNAFGAHIFSEANDCKERRQFRVNKRRINRRKYRIKLLNELLADEICNVDKNFFLRLSNSSYKNEDKVHIVDSKHLVFKDDNSEKKYYKLYPTIWHLRKALMENDAEAFTDIRFVYMALHHIIKYRGNFLKEGISYNVSEFNYSLLNMLNEELKKFYFNFTGEEIENDFLVQESYEKIKNIYLDKSTNKKEKQVALKQIFAKTTISKYTDLFISLSTGGKYSLKNICDDELDIKDIEFNDSFDENCDYFKTILEESFFLVEIAKEIYDFVIIYDLIGDKKTLSNAMVNTYDEHKNDLNRFKKLLVNIDKKKCVVDEKQRLYYKVFKDKTSKENYVSFSKQGNEEAAKIDVLNKFLLKILNENKEYIDSIEYDYFANKMQHNTLFRTISIVSTSVIPHQLHLIELEAILDNAINYYPSLSKIKEKIIKLFLFKVPYYFGPLDSRSKYSNVCRKTNERITPWNFDSNDIIDLNSTRQKFMIRLTNSCNYLVDCSVCPKVSLAYEDYMIFDRINNINLNGAKLTLDEKKDVYKYIIARNKTTPPQIKSYLSKIKQVKESDISISGISEDIAFEASSHNQLAKLFNLEEDYKQLEYYIYLATIYADDKKMLKSILQSEFKELSEKQVKCILNLPTKKWASVSYEFLNYKFYIDDNGETFSVLDLLRESSENFQQILFNKKYDIQSKIDEYNREKSGVESVDDRIQQILDNTPSIFRRSIIKTCSVIEDICKASSKNPDKIFIEVTRENDDKKKGKVTKSRKDELNYFFKELIKNAEEEYKKQIKLVCEQLNEVIDEKETFSNIRLKSRHIYLYFKQLGFDLYTGEKIDLNDVLNSNKYDLDHIIPQSLIKDDSLDNLVLVSREYNQRVKSDSYPLPDSIFNEKNRKIWKYLHKNKLISDKKYNNLERRKEISLDEIEDFVARQINVVNYSNIALRDILKLKYKNAQIIFSKAQYPHLIREKFSLIKNRDINDSHHAIDAYLNIFAGNVLMTRFSNVAKIYEERYIQKKGGTFNIEKVLLDEAIKHKDVIVSSSLRHDALVTYAYDYYDSAFYKQTIYKGALNKGSLIPVHTDKNNPMNDPNKYGGYYELKNCFLIHISYTKGKNEVNQLVGYKLLDYKLYGDNIDKITEIIRRDYLDDKCKDLKIGRRIYFNQKVCFKGGIYCLITKGDCLNFKNAYQSYLDNESLLYLNKANKYFELLDGQNEEVCIPINREGETISITKEKNQEIINKIIKLANNSNYNACNYFGILRNLNIEEFKSLSLSDQILCIQETIKVFSKDARYSKFREYFGLKGDNIFTSTNKINKTDIKIIYESPSGLFKTVKPL